MAVHPVSEDDDARSDTAPAGTRPAAPDLPAVPAAGAMTLPPAWTR